MYNLKMEKKIKMILFYITLFLFILAIGTTATGYDYDLWARLIAGMGFVQGGHVLKQDFLSYTPTHVWFDHEWGSGVIFYLVQHFFSGAGIILLQTFLVFLIFFFIAKIIKLRNIETTSSYNLLFYIFSFIAMSQTLNEPIRCQMFTFVLFTVFLYILELSRNGKDKPLFAIPFLMIIWNNLHGGCVSGIGLIAIYIVGEFLNRKPVKKYVYALISSVLVLPINPWGVEYLKFLFMANTMQRTDVMEWWGLFSKFHRFGFIQFKIFTLVLLITEIGVVVKQSISKSVFDKTKYLLIAATLFLAIQHVKLIPFAVITLTAFVYEDFYDMFNALTKNIFNKIAKSKDSIVYLIIVIFSIACVIVNGIEPRLNWYKYPLIPIEFIRINNIKGNLLINFGLGSYASYKLYPNNKIFMDGRYEEVYFDYMVPLLKKFYLADVNGKNGDWDEVLKRFPPDVMVIEKFYPVYRILLKDKKWKLVLEDSNYGVFVLRENDFKKYKKPYKAPSSELEYYKKSLFNTNIKFNP